MRLPTRARVYIAAVAVAALACIVLFVPQAEFSSQFILAWLLLAGIDFLCEIFEVEVIAKRSTSAAMAVCIAAVYIGGAPLGILTVLLATLPAELLLRWKVLSKNKFLFTAYIGFNVGQLVVSVTTTALVFKAIGGTPPPYTTIWHFVPLSFAFITYTIVNKSAVALIVYLTEKISFVYQLKFYLRHLLTQLLSIGTLGILIAVLYTLSPWYILLMLSPLTVVQASIRGYTRLRQQAQQAFERIARVVGERDPYTGEHSTKVAKLAEQLARALRLPEEEVEQIAAAARVHDLGKIAVPDRILLKPAKLSPEEWAIMTRHPVTSAELLRGLEIYEGVLDIVKHEHEHWDGTGYPDGLAGNKIPLGARILAVADVWSALTSNRPYRKAYSKQEARRILQEMKGKELDPQLVDEFLNLVP
ncbi:HD domain-containing protein [Candidatus Bipolaricaulota bacterium]|nr:HD domain-containing protein [Candidatus Bipolaricaulota bacterium]